MEEEKRNVEKEVARERRKLEDVSCEVDLESSKWMRYLGDREALKCREEQCCESLKQLVDDEHEYRKFFQQKNMMMSDMYKNMENLLMNIDKAVIAILDKDENALVEETLASEFKGIEKERGKHRNNLVELSAAF